MKFILVEDRPGFAKTATRIFSKFDVECIALAPSPLEDLGRQIFRAFSEQDADLLILDYRLDEVTPKDGVAASYRAPTVAGHIRDRRQDRPIVLLTEEGNMRDWSKRTATLRGVFDRELIKKDLRRSSSVIVPQLKALARGYRDVFDAFQATSSVKEAIARSMACVSDRWSHLAAYMPPPGPQDAASTIHWLIRTVFEFPGPLLDSSEVAARLGVAATQIEHPPLSHLLQSAEYNGAFAGIGKRWWRVEIRQAMRNIPSGDVIEYARGLGTRLEAARCTWCGASNTSRACLVCSSPTDDVHSLMVTTDTRPRPFDPAVVCFDCIQCGRDEKKPLRFDAGAELMREDLIRGHLTRESGDG